jgi:hypothetical protein
MYMTSRPGNIISGALPDPSPVDCVLALQALQSENQLHECSLPLAPSEPSFIILTCDGDRIGVIEAPSCPPGSSCSLSSLQKRVKAGRVVSLVLAPPVDVVYGDLHVAVLATLTAVVQVSAELYQPGDVGAPPAQLPVAYEVSIAHDGVLISVTVPASAPEGSRVVISRVSVAGCDVALGEAPLEVIVGFNHAPTPKGSVMAAAEAGDVPALMRLLDGGASTEEKVWVSGLIRVDLSDIGFRCESSTRPPHFPPPCNTSVVLCSWFVFSMLLPHECRLPLPAFPASPCLPCYAPLRPYAPCPPPCLFYPPSLSLLRARL